MTSLLAPDLGDRAELDAVAALHRVIDEFQALEDHSCDHDAVIAGYESAVRRVESLKLRALARADRARVAERDGLTNTASWLAVHTRTGGADATRAVHLATALAPGATDETRPCAAALAAGDVSSEHARVIVRATEQLPAGLTAAAVTEVERDLVAKAARYSPDQLRRVARRALAAVEADVAVVDAHEDALLRAEESAALTKTRLTWHDNGDGTTSGHFTVPTFASAVLVRVIQSMTAPRRARLGATAAKSGDQAQRSDWAHQSGLAFVELLEHLPTDHLHGKVAASVVISIDHENLVESVGAARLDTNDAMSAGDLRRLACGASLLPAVYGGPSLLLDLGRSSRLFSATQRVAVAARHSTCAAEGCERPVAWCELHHRKQWARGGLTNLEDAVPLCGFHHRRIHDPDYDHRYGPGGITFQRKG